MAADSLVGAEKIYIAGVEVGNFLENDICRWECVEPTYREYRNLPLVIENAMWSESGMWGLLVSQDDFAVLGGRRGFLEAIDEFYISWEVDRQRIREGVEDFEDLSWLNDLIARTI